MRCKCDSKFKHLCDKRISIYFFMHHIQFSVSLDSSRQCILCYPMRLCFISVGPQALFMGPATWEKCKFNFKTGSHSTIHTFKNYFATMFLVFNNKRYPNRSLKLKFFFFFLNGGIDSKFYQIILTYKIGKEERENISILHTKTNASFFWQDL